MSSVPKQTYGLLQSRKRVWKSTSRRRPERIHVGPQIRTPAVPLRAWISISQSLTRTTAAGRGLSVWCAGAIGSLALRAWDRHQFGVRTPAAPCREGIWLSAAGRVAPHARCVDGAATRAAHTHRCDGNGRQHLAAVRPVEEGALARSKVTAQTGRFWLRFFTGPIRFSPSS